jgi:hypothetical protein
MNVPAAFRDPSGLVDRIAAAEAEENRKLRQTIAQVTRDARRPSYLCFEPTEDIVERQREVEKVSLRDRARAAAEAGDDARADRLFKQAWLLELA